MSDLSVSTRLEDDLMDVPKNRDFVRLSKEEIMKRQWYPNAVWYRETDKLGVIGFFRSKSGRDFAVNCDALEGIVEAKREGKINQAYALTIDHDFTVLKAMPAVELLHQLEETKAHNGVYGWHFWIDEDFIPRKGNRYEAPKVVIPF